MRIENLQNENRKYAKSIENFHVLEYVQDASVSPMNAMNEYFMSKMHVRRRQVVIDIDKDHSAVIQAGAMQWMGGNVQATSGIKGIGDFLGKALKGAVTKETAVKPEYVGEGCLVLEPTYKYIILADIGKWGPAGMTIEDGMFLACDANVKSKVVARKSLSSAVLGSEGLFNLSLHGNGVAALESNVPEDELIEVILENDELKIDGNLAVCWSSNLDFTVERSTKTLVGSAVSGEGLVNVYRGTGRVLMCPVAPTTSLFESTNTMAAKAAAKSSNTFGK
ncbi:MULTISPECIES: AIM24 family protein [Blautia]|uniref:AIM24 family protein n=1 Tax=Blautia massiliensis (ex Durand et al. 2017) TaxID=1737424 RepID=A0AAW5CR77_9FIRM|nr:MULTISPECIES: AIM24 family protein [Blautia]MCG5034544.1 AIM24 family protein [Blautia massiliensis (ex Durand et al. 2017)]MCM1903051.1 AIM24 family protein [Blautia sp. MB18-30]NSK68829.1 AIM24 family protein [Blautia massiliensis (ex Durand et al. 2017)]